MQNMRDELNTFGDSVQVLTVQAQEILPLKQRRQPVTRPLPVQAICNYKQANVSVQSLTIKCIFFKSIPFNPTMHIV